MKMWVYIVRRALLLIPVIIGVMTITFAVTSQLGITDRLISEIGPNKLGYAPTIACNKLGNPNATGTCPNPAYTAGVHRLGLDRPIEVQWVTYIYDSLTLQWGYTGPHSAASQAEFGDQQLPVATVLSWYFPYTLELAAISLTIILLIAIPIGNYSAVYRNRPIDQGSRVLSFSGFALPGFILATLALVAATTIGGGFTPQCNNHSFPYTSSSVPGPSRPASRRAAIRPGSSVLTRSSIRHPPVFLQSMRWPTASIGLPGDTVFRMLIPAAVIAFGAVASILRFVRNSMLEVLNMDFVRTARAKGVTESRVVNRHAGRNSLNVTVTVLGLTFAGFIGGFPIIEEVFGLKGIGLMLALSIQPTYDYGLIFGSTLLFTIIVVIANIIVDILYAYLDPRVRLG